MREIHLLNVGVDYDYAIRTYGGKEHGQVNAVEEKTIGQYTGLCDKNGKKIFEGDIIKSLYANCKKNEHIEKAVFFDGSFMATSGDGLYTKIAGHSSPKHFDFDDSIYMIECEIIGNIHDNPELLKGGAE